MKIAVTSQNRKTITEHAGTCRKFWIFTVKENQIVDKQLLELPKEQSFRESDPHAAHLLDDIDILWKQQIRLYKRYFMANSNSLVTTFLNAFRSPIFLANKKGF